MARMFYRSAAMDLQRLEHAAAENQWQSVGELAQRIQMSCLQLDEKEAFTAMAELGCVRGKGFTGAYARHKPVVAGLLHRMKHFDH